MGLRPEPLQAFLVGDPEMLLLVYDDQAEVVERDRLAEQRMGADDDVDLAAGDAAPGRRLLPGRHQARELGDTHRQPGESLAEGVQVLPAEERGRSQHCDLLAGLDRVEGRAQRHFRLAEPDIAADQPVHRPPGAEIVDRLLDGARLILGLHIGEARAEGVVEGARRCQLRRRPRRALRREPDELLRHVADALLEPGLARLPGGAAEPVQRHRALGRAVAREQLDVLDRQEEPVVAVIEDAQAVVLCVIDLKRHQSVIAADAVVGVHHQIAVGERRRIDEEVLGGFSPAALRPAGARAEDVLLGDRGERDRDEAPLQRQHRRRRDAGRQRLRPAPVGDRLDPVHAVLAQQADHAVPAAGAAARDQDPPALLLLPVDMRADGLEQRAVPLLALGHEVPPVAGAGVRSAFALDEGRALHERAPARQPRPFVRIEKEGIGWDRMIGRIRDRGGLRVRARAEEVRDRLEAAVARLPHAMVEHHRAVRHVVEHGLQPVMEERQPVLDAGIAPAGGDRLVERVLPGHGTECAAVGGAEARDGLRIEQHLADRREVEGVGGLRAPLREGVEPAHGLDDIAEEVEPNGALGIGREDVHDTAAHGIVARLHHRAGAHESVALQIVQQGLDSERRTACERKGRVGQHGARRHPLDRRVDGGEHHGRPRRAVPQ